MSCVNKPTKFSTKIQLLKTFD